MKDKTEVLLALALSKPTEQSPTFHTYGAELAADGNRGTYLLQEQCTRHRGWRHQSLVEGDCVYHHICQNTQQRNRRRRRSVSKLTLSDRLREVTVTVGLTEFDVNTPCGFFAGPGTSSQLVVIDCTTLSRKRFVKISKTTEALILCEVDVFGFSV
nr:uncharacterized protein LOC117685179 isoform X1 [Crassostrea gigas]